MLAMTSNYSAQVGNAEPSLRRIAQAGFPLVHWAHEWCTDYLYSADDLEQIAAVLGRYGLGISHVHASEGDRGDWMSSQESPRRAGVALLANRMAMAGRLGGDVAIVHMKNIPPGPGGPAVWDAVWRSLDALRGVAEDHGVRLAVENGRFDDLEQVFARYEDTYVGLCYDAGHGNLIPDGLDRLEALQARLLSIHLHDNNGRDDVHWMPFTGTVAWDRLAGIIARSPYTGPLNVEAILYPVGSIEEEVFLAQAYEAGSKFLQMVRSYQ